jgi:D-alanine-D-alanine ligase
MDKAKTKAAAAERGVRGAKAILFPATKKPGLDDVVRELGESLIVKPNAEGSSVGLSVVSGRDSLAAALEKASAGDWLIEQRIMGRELSIGVLNGRALGVVEIRPRSGVYDYASKYTKGASEYFAPAPIDAAATAATKAAALASYEACGCRDYARVDFIFSANSELYLLEINTLPGMKETSLLPMSARCEGLDFAALVREMATPALQRFQAATFSGKP